MAQYKTFSTMANDQSNPDSSIMDSVNEVSSALVRSSIISQHRIVVIYNFTTWCGPCQQSGPIFAGLMKKYQKNGIIAFVKEDVDKKYGGWGEQIRGVPCFHFYIDGQYQKELTVVGADTDTVETTIRNLLNIQ
jgi:thiol-disulfide isomerase/thioredoxin